MRESIIAIMSIAAAAAGCTESPRAQPNAAAGAAAVPIPASNVLDGVAVDAPIPGLAGAVWSDPGNTGYVTGYTDNGQYHPGPPPGYDPATHAVTRH